MTAMMLLSQTAKSRRFWSMARPDGSLHGESGQRFITACFWASISRSSDLFDVYENVSIAVARSKFRFATQFPNVAAICLFQLRSR